MREALAYIDQSIFAESRGGRSDARKTIVLMLTTPEAESVEIKSTLTRLHALSYVLFFYIFQYFSFKTTSPDLQYQCQTSDLSLSRNLLKGKRLPFSSVINHGEIVNLSLLPSHTGYVSSPE